MGRLVAQSPVGAYLYTFMDVKKKTPTTLSGGEDMKADHPTTLSGGGEKKEEPPTTLSGGNEEKHEPPVSGFALERASDSALEDTEDEQHDLDLDLFICGSQTETPKEQEPPQKREPKRCLTNDFGDDLLDDLFGCLSEAGRQKSDLSVRNSGIKPAASSGQIQQESQDPRNVVLFPVSTEPVDNGTNEPPATTHKVDANSGGSTPLPKGTCLGEFVADLSGTRQVDANSGGSTPLPKGTCLGRFVVDSSGTRQVDANASGDTPLPKGKTSDPKPKRLTRKQREALERAGVTPPLKATRRDVAKRQVGPSENASPKNELGKNRSHPRRKNRLPPKQETHRLSLSGYGSLDLKKRRTIQRTSTVS